MLNMTPMQTNATPITCLIEGEVCRINFVNMSENMTTRVSSDEVYYIGSN